MSALAKRAGYGFACSESNDVRKSNDEIDLRDN